MDDWLVNPDADYYQTLQFHRANRIESFPVDDAEGLICFGREDAKEVLGDQDRFSSTIVANRRASALGATTIVGLEGDGHRELRDLLMHELRPSELKRLATEVIEPAAHELIDQMLNSPSPDLVADYSRLLPALVISRILGFDTSGYESVPSLVDDLFNFGLDPKRGMRASRQLRSFCARELLRGHEDDLTGRLSRGLIGGSRMAHEDLLATTILILGAGSKTTSDALANALLTLVNSQADPTRDEATLAAFVEEVLRFESPAQMVARVAAVDTQIGGRPVNQGTVLLVHLGSANRDETFFRDPDKFDPKRPDVLAHLAFGWGSHRCVGQHLARLEIAIAIRTLAARMPSFNLVENTVPMSAEGRLFRSVPALRLRT